MTRPYAHDYKGLTIGHLTVLRLADKKPDRAGRYWLCRCSCGVEKDIVTARLTEAKTLKTNISCGCQKVERMRIMASNKPITNPYRDPNHPSFFTFVTWQRMIKKCYNVGDSSYESHGGIGRKVHAPWRSNFENFVKDMGNRTPDQHLILIDKDKDFEPGNCKWGSLKEERELLVKWRQKRDKSNSRDRVQLADPTRLPGKCETSEDSRSRCRQIPAV